MTTTDVGTQAAALQARLSDPKVAAQLSAIVDKLDVLDAMLTSVGGLLERGEVIADSLGDTIKEATGLNKLRNGEAKEGDINPFEALATLTRVAPKLLTTLQALEPALGSDSLERMAQPRVLDALAELASSKVLDKEVVQSVGEVGDALLATKHREAQSPHSVGLFGLLRAMGDPDCKRALGFLTVFLKEYGRRLSAN